MQYVSPGGSWLVFVNLIKLESIEKREAQLRKCPTSLLANLQGILFCFLSLSLFPSFFLFC